MWVIHWQMLEFMDQVSVLQFGSRVVPLGAVVVGISNFGQLKAVSLLL